MITSYLTVLAAVCMSIVIALPQCAQAAPAAAASGQSNANSTPVNVIILIDKSGSMQKTDKEEQAKSAAMQFLDVISNDNTDTNLSEVTDLAHRHTVRDSRTTLGSKGHALSMLL